MEIRKHENISGITRDMLLEILGYRGGIDKLGDIGLMVIKEGPSGSKTKKLIISDSTFDKKTPEDIASAIHTLQKHLR